MTGAMRDPGSVVALRNGSGPRRAAKPGDPRRIRNAALCPAIEHLASLWAGCPAASAPARAFDATTMIG